MTLARRCSSCEESGVEMRVCPCGDASHDYCADEDGWSRDDTGQDVCEGCATPFVVRCGARLSYHATARDALAAMAREASAGVRAEVGTIKAGVFEAICYEEVKP